MDHNRHWVGTWATSPAPSEAGVGFNNHTLRMNPRISIGGNTLRVRVSNAYGHSKLVIGAGYVGIRDKGPAIAPGSERQLTFGGSCSATVAAGAADAIRSLVVARVGMWRGPSTTIPTQRCSTRRISSSAAWCRPASSFGWSAGRIARCP